MKLMVRMKPNALDARKYLKTPDVTWRILQTEYAQNLSAANAASSGIRRTTTGKIEKATFAMIDFVANV